jgi:hypothetical protein
MLCVFALAPASPLIAPAAFIYFLFCTPMLRWTMIFLYKPKFDIGGQRFPFIFDMCISGMFVGQVLLVAMMALKLAIGPAFAAFCPMIPTLFYRYVLRRRYLRAFNDAALLQTSLLVSAGRPRDFRIFIWWFTPFIACRMGGIPTRRLAKPSERSFDDFLLTVTKLR